MDEPCRFDWTLIRSFLAVLDAGSMLGASKRLKSTQATLSRHIAELERQLGAALFERTGRGVVATAAALRMVDAARRMESDAAQVSAAITATKQEGHGTVRISCSQVVSAFLMPGLVADLTKNNPGLQIELASTNQASNLLRREADIAVRLARPNQAGLVAKRVANIQMGVFASRNYVKNHGAPLDLQALLNHRLIGLDIDVTLIAALRRLGIPATRESFFVRTDDQVAGIRLVEAGVGVGVMPTYVAAGIDGVVRLLVNTPMPELPVWLAVHREIRASRIIRSVFDFLVSNVAATLGNINVPAARLASSTA